MTADHGGNYMKADAAVSTASSASAMGFVSIPSPAPGVGGTVTGQPGMPVGGSTTTSSGSTIAGTVANGAGVVSGAGLLPTTSGEGGGAANGVIAGSTTAASSSTAIVDVNKKPPAPKFSEGASLVPGTNGAGARLGYVPSCWMQRPLFTIEELKARTLVVTNLAPHTKANQLMTFVNT